MARSTIDEHFRHRPAHPLFETSIPVVIGLAMALVPVFPAGAQETPGGYSQEELRAIGKRYFEETIAEHGRADNEIWDEDFRTVLERLLPVLERPDLDITYAIVDTDDFNAFAAPGGYIVFYAGLMRFFEEAGRQDEPGNPERQRARARAYLAAVLGHELAHITLGHTGTIMERVRNSLGEEEYEALLAAGPDGYESERRLDRDIVEQRAYSREREFAADATGALYALRAGWEIQDAMDLWGQKYALNRRDPASGVDLESSTYVRTHPRASDRVASLEASRAELKFDQARLDDAVAFLRSNVELDAAIQLLDIVLEHFPDLLAARHARGAAHHRKWLNTVPIQTQRLRASFPTHNIDLLGQIRGPPGDLSLLGAAQADYEAVLAIERLPSTLANAALLDMYVGRAERARGRAREAAELAPDDPEILNNVGVALFLDGQTQAAREIFERAIEASESRTAALTFNLGTTLFVLEDAAGRDLLYAYARADRTTAWRDLALSLLRADGGEAMPPPEDTDATPPEVGGLSLGMTYEDVLSVVGRPSESRILDSGATLHRFDSSLLIRVDGDHDRVVTIILMMPGAGTLFGLRVGDSMERVDGTLGPASDRDQWSAYYDRDTWYIGVGYSEGMVEMLAIGVRE